MSCDYCNTCADELLGTCGSHSCVYSFYTHAPLCWCPAGWADKCVSGLHTHCPWEPTSEYPPNHDEAHTPECEASPTREGALTPACEWGPVEEHDNTPLPANFKLTLPPHVIHTQPLVAAPPAVVDALSSGA